MPDVKSVFGIVAVAMTVTAHLPYLATTLRGTNRPHIFTWIIWTLLTFIAAAVQFAGHAGWGAGVTLVTGILCIVIALAAFRQGERDITRGDWVMFIGGLATIPLWILTSSPLWSILIVTAIDCSAFVPTFRKSWHRPRQENSFMYGFNIPRHVCSILSITQMSVVTAVYPAALLAMNILMYAMLKTRRCYLIIKP